MGESGPPAPPPEEGTAELPPRDGPTIRRGHGTQAQPETRILTTSWPSVASLSAGAPRQPIFRAGLVALLLLGRERGRRLGLPLVYPPSRDAGRRCRASQSRGD